MRAFALGPAIVIVVALMAGCSGPPSGFRSAGPEEISVRVVSVAVHAADYCRIATDGGRYETGGADGCFQVDVALACGKYACLLYGGGFTLADGNHPPSRELENGYGEDALDDDDCTYTNGGSCEASVYFRRPTNDLTPWTAFTTLYWKFNGDVFSATLPTT